MHSTLVGITGKIASGKSFVIRYLRSKGYKIFIADDVVHNLYELPEVQNKVKEIVPELKRLNVGQIVKIFFSTLFGATDNIDHSPVNKNRLAKIIFKDEGKRRKLEELIHPMVTKELKAFAGELKEGDIGFAEVPLLFEAKMENIFDYIILVHCERSIRLKRAAERGTFQSKFDMIDKVQMSDEKKMMLADFVIDSNMSKAMLNQKIDETIRTINERNNTRY